MAEAHDPPDLAEPPAPPEMPRRIRLHGGQWVGIPLLVLIPILAALNVFGETRRIATVQTSALDVQFDHPSRLRTGQRSEVEVRVWNTTDATLDSVTVIFDPEYFSRFAQVSFMPDPATPYQVQLLEVGAGEVEVLRVELEGDRAWWSRGRAGVRHGDTTTHVEMRTFVFP
jgi:hypothetical protein